MISQFTWPNFHGESDKEGVKILIKEQNFTDDVKYGKTKIFLRSPQTLFKLEQVRTLDRGAEAVVCFCWIKAPTICRAIGMQGRGCQGPTVASPRRRPGEPPWLVEAVRQCTRRLGRTPPVSGGRQSPGGGSGTASYPVDDVQQARITQGAGGWR